MVHVSVLFHAGLSDIKSCIIFTGSHTHYWYVEYFKCSLLPVFQSLMGFIAAQHLEKYLSAIIRAITECTVNSPESAEETLLSHVRIWPLLGSVR